MGMNRAPVGKSRAGVENMGGGAAAAMFIVSLIPESWSLDPYQLTLLGVVATSVVATLTHILRDYDVPGFGSK